MKRTRRKKREKRKKGKEKRPKRHGTVVWVGLKQGGGTEN